MLKQILTRWFSSELAAPAEPAVAPAEPAVAPAEPAAPAATTRKRRKTAVAPTEPAVPAATTRKRRKTAVAPADAESAEPHVQVKHFHINADNPGQGEFELDFNQAFVHQLRKLGYQGLNDNQVVDQWFTDVCRNVALNTWEQLDADPSNRVTRRPLQDGRTEFS